MQSPHDESVREVVRVVTYGHRDPMRHGLVITSDHDPHAMVISLDRNLIVDPGVERDMRVHPQQHGISVAYLEGSGSDLPVATALTTFALDWLKNAGMSVAMVETGTDPGHAPARGTYEKVGFNQVSVARYFKKL